MSGETDKPKSKFWTLIDAGPNAVGAWLWERTNDVIKGENNAEEFYEERVVPTAKNNREVYNNIKKVGTDRIDDVKDAWNNRTTIAKGITEQDVQTMRSVDNQLKSDVEALEGSEKERFDNTRNIVRLALGSNYPLSFNDASQRGAGFDKITEVLLREENLGDAFDAFKNGGSKHLFFAETYFKQLGQDASDKGFFGTIGNVFGGIGKFVLGAFNFIKDWMSEGLDAAKENFQNNILTPGEALTKDVLKRDITERLENIKNDLMAEGFSETKADAIITVMKKETNKALARDGSVPETFKGGLFTEEEIKAGAPKEELSEPVPEEQQAQTQNTEQTQGQDVGLDENLSAPPTPAASTNEPELTPSEMAAANRGY